MSDATLMSKEVINIDAKEITKNNQMNEFAITCKHAVPIRSSVTQKKDENLQAAANVSYLCRDEDNNLFIINRIFAIKDELEQLSFESLPFSAFETDYITQKIEYQWLTSYLPRYTTNFQFYLTNDYSKVYTYGIKADNGKKYKIEMSNELFMGLLYLDKYPLEDDSDNEHDLSLAILNTVRPVDADADFFRIGNVEIIGMADAAFREEPTGFFDKLKSKFSKNELVSTDIAVEFNLINANNLEESVQLLAPFDTGIVFEQEKYKGETINNIFDNYLINDNQYVANLTVLNTRLFGVNKNFMIIRGENKNKEVKLFLIDDASKDHINNLINEY